jgi:hypothetical protein
VSLRIPSYLFVSLRISSCLSVSLRTDDRFSEVAAAAELVAADTGRGRRAKREARGGGWEVRVARVRSKSIVGQKVSTNEGTKVGRRMMPGTKDSCGTTTFCVGDNV